MLCANQTAHSLSLINVFVIPCLDSTNNRLAAYKFSRFWLAEYVDGCLEIKTIFILDSTEHEIYPADSFTNRKHFKVFEISWAKVFFMIISGAGLVTKC